MSADETDAAADATPKEFEGDLTGAVFWGAELRGARFRDVDLTGARISHAWLVDVDIDALVDRLVINGVDVTSFVNERDPWYPLRGMLRPDDPEGLRATWAALGVEWKATVAQARALSDEARHASVDGEWSFVETLRHLVFAIDKWFTVPFLGERFDPIGLPNSGSADFPWPDVDQTLRPTFDESFAVHADRTARIGRFLATIETADFARPIEVLENGRTTVQEGLFTVFEETFWHNRYARRDLERLQPSG